MIPAMYYPYVRNNDLTAQRGNIKVNGTGIVKVKPNVVTIQLGVITKDKSAKNAQQENAANSTRLISALKGTGIETENIQTISYTVFPNYKVVDREQVLDGFEVSHQLEVTLYDIKKVGEVYDLAFLSGANTAQNLIFQVLDSSRYIQEALTKAVEDSVHKAQTIAHSVGSSIHPIPIKIIELGDVQPFRPHHETFMVSTATPIMMKDVEIIAKVETLFAYI